VSIEREVPEGYLSITIHEHTAARVRGLGGGQWRAPIHGTSVMVASDGTVLAHVRTLGQRLPSPDRRYSLRVKGVTFTRILPQFSRTRPIVSDLAPYRSMKAAQEAGSAIVQQMIGGGEQ
jgi:hypothetical protein